MIFNFDGNKHQNQLHFLEMPSLWIVKEAFCNFYGIKRIIIRITFSKTEHFTT